MKLILGFLLLMFVIVAVVKIKKAITEGAIQNFFNSDQ